MIRFVIPYVLYSFAALLCILLQSALFSHLQIFNVKPDLLLLLVLMSGLKSDWKNGIAVGLLAGFWIDLLNAGYFGMNMVVYAIIGALSGMIGSKFPNRTYEGYFFFAVMASLLSGFLTLALFHLLGATIPVGQSIAGIIIPMTFYTALMAFLGLPLVWIYRHISGRKIGRIDLIGNGVVIVRGNEKVDLSQLAARRRERSRRKLHDRYAAHRKQEHRRQTHGHGSAAGSHNAPRHGTGQNRRNRGYSGVGENRDKKRNRSNSAENKPRSYPRRRPQKHSGRRSK